MTASSHRSFAEQALHYFARPHDSVPSGPVGGPAAWRGPDLAAREDWIVRLDDDDVAEIESAARAVAGRPLGEIGRDDFPLPRLAPRVREWAREVGEGRGVLLVRGLPVARWGEELASRAFWGLGHYLGVPGGQNPQEELLGHVRDYGEDASNPYVRKYRTADDIAFHCDLADVVGLLCLAPARRGGASRLASSVTVHDELVRTRPDLTRRLHEPFLLDTRDEGRERSMPWFPVQPCCHAGGRLRTFWHSDYFRSVERHAEAPRFTAAERELLDLYDAVAGSPGVRFDMELQAGDVQLVSNHTVVHARTAYEDDPASPRHLLRLWLSLS